MHILNSIIKQKKTAIRNIASRAFPWGVGYSSAVLYHQSRLCRDLVLLSSPWFILEEANFGEGGGGGLSPIPQCGLFWSHTLILFEFLLQMVWGNIVTHVYIINQ